MSLEDYKKKRKFNKTPEPKGEIGKDGQRRFVIQRHQATRLHYDLRLEMDGVLKSWAVPKGPSQNPSDKRLAIQTEDHPVKYLTFHGVIPKGNYGAGVMDIWDSGTYRVIESNGTSNPVSQLHKGDLKLEFFGNRIKGAFALVHTQRGEKNNQWLLVKKKDEYATDLAYDAEVFVETGKKSAQVRHSLNLDDFVRPMLASATKTIFKDPDWVFELKWDGYRVLANIKGGEVNIYSRNGISYNAKFSPIKEALEHIPHDCILDGEVIVVNEKGKNDFQKLQNFDPHSTKERLQYQVFDLLHLNGIDTISLPLVERKGLLPEILEGLHDVFYCDHIVGMGPTLFDRAVEAGMEGVMAKKANSTYLPGYRSENWLKIKDVNSEEAIICGYTDSKTGGNLFGSLILGVYKEGELTYAGNCGSGFTISEQKMLLERFEKRKTDQDPFKASINLKGRKPHWLIPELICEVRFTEWTKSGVMRHPVYKGLRADKNTDEIVAQEENTEPSSAAKGISSTLEVDGIAVPLSNLDKVYWPESGYTKYDLIDYYLHVSDYILPYLIDRPQNLHRYPNGIDKPAFYQKDNEVLPKWVDTVKIYSESSRKEIEYLVCQNEATLLYMANLGCIEINPWNSVIQDLEHPTYTVIDIDPSDKSTFMQVKEVALAAKEVLDRAKIIGYPKTSGSSGIHIYIPLNAKYTYDEARDFTKLLCYYVKEKLPKLTTMERNIRKRNDRIYLDFLQNRRGQTLAAPYCVRPKKGATVSAPIAWHEITASLKISDFNIQNMVERVENLGDIFLPVLQTGIDMEKAMENLVG